MEPLHHDTTVHTSKEQDGEQDSNSQPYDAGHKTNQNVEEEKEKRQGQIQLPGNKQKFNINNRWRYGVRFQVLRGPTI